MVTDRQVIHFNKCPKLIADCKTCSRICQSMTYCGEQDKFYRKGELDNCNRCNKLLPAKDMIEQFTMSTFNEPSSPDGYICQECAKQEENYFKEQEQKHVQE